MVGLSEDGGGGGGGQGGGVPNPVLGGGKYDKHEKVLAVL